MKAKGHSSGSLVIIIRCPHRIIPSCRNDALKVKLIRTWSLIYVLNGRAYILPCLGFMCAADSDGLP